MKTLLLCGGRGVLDPETRTRIPKCMLKIGNRPLIWHVMKLFASYGHTEFVLSLGSGGEIIKNYFVNAFELLHDIEINISSNQTQSLNRIPEENWTVKLIDTGTSAFTGARIARCERYLAYEPFFISYTDILADVDIDALYKYHQQQNKMFTITGVNPPSRFGTFYMAEDQLIGYNANAVLAMHQAKINGGFMIANPDIFKVLSPITECNLEVEVFSQLVESNNVALWQHNGFWQNIDTERDIQYIQSLYDANQRPWLGINY